MSATGGRQRRNNEHQQAFTRQATILRKNLYEWDRMLRTPRGEDWPTMVGRLNAAMVRRKNIKSTRFAFAHPTDRCSYITQNQTNNLDRSIDDVLEHFVYLPKQSTANPQDIPFFLSTRLADAAGENAQVEPEDIFGNKDPVQVVARYENRAAQLAAEYEENMVRF
jgi:hypothetical protein